MRCFGHLLIALLPLWAMPAAHAAPHAPLAPPSQSQPLRLLPVQFQVPQAGTEVDAPPGRPEGQPPPALPQRLTYAYGFGSESEGAYRDNADLDDRAEDEALIVAPQVNGYFTYRPTDWLEATVELILEKQFAVIAEGAPDEDRDVSLLVDQAFVTFQNVIDPFSISLGRRNFEDERHWLYDTSLDMGMVAYRRGAFSGFTAIGREVLTDLDLLARQQRERIDTLMLYGDWRGVPSVTFAGYAIGRDDELGDEGQAWITGLRALGRPTSNFSFWGEAALVRGSDDLGRDLQGYAVDVGGSYWFPDLPLSPSLTLGFAHGSGDGDPNDGTNHAFRQTGLQSNEARFNGVSEFKVYGEALDPELSNLQVVTVGLGVRPNLDVSFDLVYHHYRLDEFADELNNAAITADLNRRSKDLGSGIDAVLGIRNILGHRNIGIDLRAGVFLPGPAFDTDEGDAGTGPFREADHAVAIVLKVWL